MQVTRRQWGGMAFAAFALGAVTVALANALLGPQWALLTLGLSILAVAGAVMWAWPGR